MAKPPGRSTERKSRAAKLEQFAKEVLIPRAMEVTAPVYSFRSGRPEAVGSAVLVQVGGARLLVSAAHVLDWRHLANLGVGVAGTVVDLRGNVTRFFLNDETRPDSIDLGIVELVGSEWSSLPDSAFLRAWELDPEPASGEREPFNVLGYPETKQRGGAQGTAVRATVFSFLAFEAARARYEERELSPELHVILKFDKKRTWNSDGQRTAPDLYGVSGGSVWRIDPNAPQPVVLSAIAVEWHRTSRFKHVLCTRLGPILEGIGMPAP